MARPGLAIGGIALIVAGAAIGFGWWWPSTSEATAQVDTKIQRVRLASDSGSVHVRAADVQQSTVVQRFDYRWGEPDQSYSVNGDELVLADCGNWCSVDYDVVVPFGTTVSGDADSGEIVLTGVASADVTADSGSVDVRNVAGPVTVQVSSGNVTLADLGSTAKVVANSGKISGTGLKGSVDAQADSGDIELVMAAAQEVKAHADSGEVEVTVPPGTYRVEGDTDSGSRDISIPTGGGGTAVLLQLNTESGDVTVRQA
ncbi:DUF4097 family beta strand repeat-containing protein [Amycolatopsis sp. 195334CR]|uniref:DUF4097 family beta strand repeat-containing protein n=1 Tax=Amycolatopsis sp. 195334CR TaxID=2814588 RepID=UPI001A8F2C7B|nr:DUF4097 family beta strand repeat-containing protein [Amycolatopsis sp. 195334CR]MBN6035791.1 DUF4097 family beta strand repeat protein [Amycolatopsis sp. 195334CR]